MSRVAWWALTPTLHFAPVLCATTGHHPAEGLPVIALFISASTARSLAHSTFRQVASATSPHAPSPSREDSKKYVNSWFLSYYRAKGKKINNGRGVLMASCWVSQPPLFATSTRVVSIMHSATPLWKALMHFSFKCWILDIPQHRK